MAGTTKGNTMQLRSVELWDGESDRGRVDLSWTVSGVDAVITAVTPTSDTDTDTDAAGAGDEGDAWAGLSIIPGLIDTHVHLLGKASEGHADFLGWPLVTRSEEQVLHGLSHAQRALKAGITTLRDLSADEVQVSLRRALDAGIVEGPRLMVSGMVSMTAGHGDMFTPEAFPIRRQTADGPDECRKLVRHWARTGVDGIKIATSGGVLSTGDKASWRNYTREEIETIVDESHALGMLVAAHAHTEAGIQIALDTGCDSIEHGTFISAAQAEEAARRGVSIAPTMLINEAIATRRVPVSDEQAQKARDVIVQRDGLMRAAADLGADFVLGTDANGYHVQFGDEMDELRLLASVVGYSPERALQAATTRAALAIGRADDLGRLAPGFKADFVVMRGRPWENLDDLRVENIVAVVARGKVVAGALPTA